MKSDQLEKEVRSAVNKIAASINRGSNTTESMDLLVDVTSKLPLKKLDYWERLLRYEYQNARHPMGGGRWRRRKEHNYEFSWLDITSWNGYRREEALNALPERAPNSFCFALAFRKLNDWVPNVRLAAGNKLLNLAKNSDTKHVAEVITTILPHLSSWGRIEEVGRETIFEVVNIEPVFSYLVDTLISSPTGPMPALFSQISRSQQLDRYLEKISIAAAQPTVRAKAIRFQFEGKASWVHERKWVWTDLSYLQGKTKPVIGERELTGNTLFLPLLERSMLDVSPIVRKVAAEYLIRNMYSLKNKAYPYARKLALDSSLSVSERGDFVLRKLKEIPD